MLLNKNVFFIIFYQPVIWDCLLYAESKEDKKMLGIKMFEDVKRKKWLFGLYGF